MFLSLLNAALAFSSLLLMSSSELPFLPTVLFQHIIIVFAEFILRPVKS